MNLRAKTSLFTLTFIVVILLTYSFLDMRREARQEKEQLLASGLSFAELTAAHLTSDYEKYYRKAFYNFLSSVKELYELNEDLYKIELVDVSGTILLGIDETEHSAPVPWDRRLPKNGWEYSTLRSVRPHHRYRTIGPRDLLVISYPVLLQSGIHQYNVLYYYSFEALQERLAQMRNDTIHLFLVFIVIGFLGTSAFSYGLTRKVKKLVNHAHLIAEGDLDRPVKVSSKDEIGELATSFEHMRTEIRRKNDEIESYNRKLEEKVMERTAELRSLTSQLQRNNIILQEANEKLLELDRLKSEFLANTSHELRTPLTSILGYSQCVLAELDGPLPDGQKENVKKILSSGRDLLELINRLLDFSRLESGRITLDLETVDIRGVIEEAVTTVRPLSEEKGLDLITRIDPDIPPLTADRMRIKQTVLNLLSNAVKFTDRGFVKVTALRSNGDIQVSVEDTGIGIDYDHHEAIFDAFRQVDGSVQRKYGGSGLGLTISRMLIEMHQGRIWVDSEKEKGTTFSFTLPIKQGGHDDIGSEC